MMGNELSGIVACLQEIELACIELEGHDSEEFVAALREIKAKAQVFLKAPSVDGAEDFFQFLEQGKSKVTEHKMIAAIFASEVTVDGLKTSLYNLTLELEELIEDLRSWQAGQN